MRHAFLGLIAAALIPWSGAHAQQSSYFNAPAPTPGVYAFGDFRLDFNRNVEVPNRGRPRPLRDCSSLDTYCAAGQVFQAAFPRTCDAYREGAQWTYRGMRMAIVDVGRLYFSGAARPDAAFVVMNLAKPDVVYVYTMEQGVMGFFYDGGRSLLADARAGRFTPSTERTSTVRHLYHDRRFSRPFGPCIA